MKTAILIFAYGLAGFSNVAVNTLYPPAATVLKLQDTEKFAGSSPGGNFVKKFLTIPADENVELIRWNISLERNHTFTLQCAYGKMQQGSQNFIGGVSQNAVSVNWGVEMGSKSDPDAIVYRLTSQSGTSIDLVRMDENILHLLFRDGSLLIGDGGQSYTLNKIKN